jgi:hypothetical protein
VVIFILQYTRAAPGMRMDQASSALYSYHATVCACGARLKRACKLYRDDDAEKVRALAREILNDSVP